MLYTEMVTTGALIHGPREQLLKHEQDSPCAVQLGGSDPADLATAAVMVQDAGYQEVNINCGCPSDRVQQGGIGACLMGEPALVAECFTAITNAVEIPVTIKSRIGIDDQDSFEFFSTFIDTLHKAGARHFQIHARKAVLKGLSPKENREIPPLKYDYVSRIKLSYPDLEFILNGGIKTVDQAQELLQEFDGVMLGRAPYSHPWLLSELDTAIFGSEPLERMTAFNAYRSYMIQQMAEGTHLKHMAKHLLGYFAGFPGARAYRRHLSENMFRDDADIDVIDAALGQIRYSNPMEQTGT